jgi:uncharacterized membrane protein YfcA
VVGVYALAMFVGFTALIMLNIAVISRDPPIIFAITVVVMSLAFIWEMLYRRRKAAARPAPRAQAVRPARPASAS